MFWDQEDMDKWFELSEELLSKNKEKVKPDSKYKFPECTCEIMKLMRVGCTCGHVAEQKELGEWGK